MSGRARRLLGPGLAALFGAACAGAAVAYFFDGQSGRQRRARVRDAFVRAEHAARDAVREREHDLQHRGRGALARLRALWSRGARDDSEDVLVERVRARLGHACSHAHAIEVHALGGGRIELFGAVLAREHAGVVSAIRRVGGVRAVDDSLVDRGTDAEVNAFRSASPPAAFARVSLS